MNYLNHDKAKTSKWNFKIFFINVFIIFFTYIKMSKNLSAKCYQENKERLQKKARERYQNLSKD